MAKFYLRTWFNWAFRSESSRGFLFTPLKSRPAAPTVTGSESWYLINTQGNSVSHLIGDSCLKLRICWKEMFALLCHYLRKQGRGKEKRGYCSLDFFFFHLKRKVWIWNLKFQITHSGSAIIIVKGISQLTKIIMNFPYNCLAKDELAHT